MLSVEMSWYTNFFVRDSGDNFTEIASFSRNFPISRVFPDSPAEKIRFCTADDWRVTTTTLREEIASMENAARDSYELDKQIGAATGVSMDDRLEAWGENRTHRAELKEEIDELTYALHVAEFLSDINQLYIGDEISDPTVEDLVKDE